MAAPTMNIVLRHLRSLICDTCLDDLSDAELIDRFARHRDRSAFEVLVRRYGTMVYGVCRRILRDEHAAEDAFQATFLVLAAKADSIRKLTSVGSWLYGVALRVSKDARVKLGRRRTLEQQAASMRSSATLEPAVLEHDRLDDLSTQETRAALDEEMARLPEQYRTPLFLCYLQGMTNAEAAQALGWPVGSMSWKLDKARELLRSRLARRGVALTSAVLVEFLTYREAVASMPAGLVQTTVQAALARAAGDAALANTPAALLAEGALRSMFIKKTQVCASVVVLLALFGAGTTSLMHQAFADKGDKPVQAPVEEIVAQGDSKKDLLGDALPADAVSRLGTSRWRNESALCFLDDNKVVVTLHDNVVRHREVPSGKEIKQFKLDGKLVQFAMAAKVGRLAYIDDKGKLHALDLKDGTALKPVELVSDKGKGAAAIMFGGGGMMVSHGQGSLAISENGQVIAYRGQTQPQTSISLFDVEDGKFKKRKAVTLERPKQENQNAIFFGGGAKVALSPDGTRAATQDPQGNLVIVDTKTGKELHKVAQGGQAFEFASDFCFTPDGKTLVSRDVAGLHVIDVETGKKETKVKDQMTNLQDSALSPDGKTFAGRAGTVIHCWNIESGKKADLGRPAAAPDGNVNVNVFFAFDDMMGNGQIATGLAFSADSKFLAVGGVPFSIWDMSAAKDLLAETGHQQPVVACAFSKDGTKAVTVGEDYTVRSWDRAQSKQTAKFSLPKEVCRVALNGEGTMLAAGMMNGNVQIWDVNKGESKHTFKGPKGAIGGVSFTPGGKLLAGIAGETAYVWDLESNKELHQVSLNDPNTPKDENAGIFGLMEMGSVGLSARSPLLFTADGNVLVWTAGTETQFIGVATGRVLHKIANKKGKGAANENANIMIEGVDFGFPLSRAMSKDGRMVACQEGDDTIAVYETTTGKLRSKCEFKHSEAKKKGNNPLMLMAAAPSVPAIAFSQDGRTLAFALAEGVVVLADALTGKEISRLKGHTGAVETLEFSRDGKSLISGGKDTTSLVWNLAKYRPADPSRINVDDAWQVLANDDGAKAFAAILSLAAEKDAVDAIAKKVQPAPNPNVKEIAQMIRDLDSNDFSVRDKAYKSLIGIGRMAEPQIRAELKKPIETLELRRRLEKILDQIQDEVLSNDRIQEVRGVEVLERIGSADAKKLLDTLAKGAEGARLTREAKAALKRME